MRNRQAIRRLSPRAAMVRALTTVSQLIAAGVALYYTALTLRVLFQLSSRIL